MEKKIGEAAHNRKAGGIRTLDVRAKTYLEEPAMGVELDLSLIFADWEERGRVPRSSTDMYGPGLQTVKTEEGCHRHGALCLAPVPPWLTTQKALFANMLVNDHGWDGKENRRSTDA